MAGHRRDLAVPPAVRERHKGDPGTHPELGRRRHSQLQSHHRGRPDCPQRTGRQLPGCELEQPDQGGNAPDDQLGRRNPAFGVLFHDGHHRVFEVPESRSRHLVSETISYSCFREAGLLLRKRVRVPRCPGRVVSERDYEHSLLPTTDRRGHGHRHGRRAHG